MAFDTRYYLDFVIHTDMSYTTCKYRTMCWYIFCGTKNECKTLQWRHIERDGVSDHQHRDCLLSRLLRRRPKETSKLRVTGLCAGNSPVTGEFPTQRASNTGNVSIWWRHHDLMRTIYLHLRLWFVGSVGSANSLSHRQNGGHFTADISKCIFFNIFFCILIEIVLKFDPKGPVDNKSALAQVTAWRKRGGKPILH